MSSRERKILLGSGVLPVILGGNPFSALLFSLKLYAKYGVCSVFYGKGCLFVSLFNPKCGAMPWAEKENPRLFEERLLDFALERDALTLVIVPMSNKAKELVSDTKSELESRYIILDRKDSVFSHPLFNERYLENE